MKLTSLMRSCVSLTISNSQERNTSPENYRRKIISKTIAEQINDLQTENSRLKELEKFFDKAIKNEFHMDKKSIHKLLKNW